MEGFKVGDTVICNRTYPSLPQKGWKGKVIVVKEHLRSFLPVVGVEWEEKFKMGHSCDGSGEYKYCRYYDDYYYDTASSSLNVISKYQKQLELF